MTDQIDLEPLKEEERGLLTDTDRHIVNLFETELNAAIQTNVNEIAEKFVTEVSKFAPIEKSGLDPISFVSSFWQVLIYIASRVPHRSIGQDILVETVILLKEGGRNYEPMNTMWENLSVFGLVMRDGWNHSPTFEPDSDDDRAFSEFEWLNLNSFVARLFSAEIVRWYNLPIWELRVGLESPISEEPAIANTKVRVASEWIIQSAQRLLRESLLNTCSTEPEGGTHGYPYSGGPLYLGVSGYNLERWGLWKRRLGELLKESDDNVRGTIDEAIHAMTTVEKRVASSIFLSIA